MEEFIETLQLAEVYNFFNTELIGKKFVFELSYRRIKIELPFSFTEDQLCHLIFGTSGKSSTNKLKGKIGFQNLENLSHEELSKEEKKAFKSKGMFFLNIEYLLNKPDGAIMYNEHLANMVLKRCENKNFESELSADYLIWKDIDNFRIILFLVEKKSKYGYILKPNSFIVKKNVSLSNDSYILYQKIFNIKNLKKQEENNHN